MKKFLSSTFLLPYYGVFIKFFAAIGFLQPIILLTLYFCEEYKGSNTTAQTNTKKLKILALSPHRFRNDLDVLVNTGKFEIITLPHFWMCRILYSFYRGKVSFEEFYNITDSNKKEHERITNFMNKFLPLLYKKMGTDIVLSAAVHYASDHLWGKYSSENGVSFVVIHRESFMASEYIRKLKTDNWKEIGNAFVVDLLISQTKAAYSVFIDAGICTKDNSAYAGTLRMGDFIKKYYNVKIPLPKDKQATLFSFTYAFGVWSPVPHWYENHDDFDGFSKMFDEVHATFAKFAKLHPDIKCVIKPKWGGRWIEKIDRALKRYDLDRKDIANLEIIVDVNVHDLISNSNVICGYGSTTLLESIVIGDRPIVIPQLGEIQYPQNADKIMMKESMCLFDVAYSADEFIEKIENGIKNNHIPEKIQKEREKLFETWSSPLNKDVVEQYTHLLQAVVEKKASERL